MNAVNLKLLQTFLLVAEHGSFRRAAEIANRAPSAISMQIRDLEAQVGLRLFVRKAQRISLSPEGRRLFDRTKGAMDNVQSELSELSNIAARRRGQVQIGCAPTLAASYMGDILYNFARRYPDSVVSVREVPPTEGLELLQQQKVEFYIGPEVAGIKDFEFEALITDQLLACTPPQFDTGVDQISVTDLDKTPMILLDSKTALRLLVDQVTKRAGITLNVRYELQNATTAMNLVEAGLGVAILPEIVAAHGDKNRFRAIPLSDPMTERMIGIVTARGYVKHNYSERLLAFIRAGFGGRGTANLGELDI
ncbi:LysR substrate-binding domain-containing protein [uncultured Litoreibacter sp.]|uniref:LysR family transcriptional regulator n=1 Tax=uncultured Litoreibacter sp. TaxID=1392394 RepID=UPI002627EDA4|nr:LysR substrate-binding domain-containing protein [uncultured Litoreibacter sp.]